MPWKYFEERDGFSPSCKTNIPIGSFPKTTSTEKLFRELGIYDAIIEIADISPLMILAEITLSQRFLQSTAESMRA